MLPGIHKPLIEGPTQSDPNVSNLTHSMGNLTVDVCKSVPECNAVLSMTNVSIFKIYRFVRIYTYVYLYIQYIYIFKFFYKMHIYNTLIVISYHYNIF